MESKFEDSIISGIKQSIQNQIAKETFVSFTHSERRRLPSEFIDRLWGTIDWEEVLETVRPEIQTQICNVIVGNLATEIKTDVKALLSVAGVRAKLRMDVYPILMQTLNKKVS